MTPKNRRSFPPSKKITDRKPFLNKANSLIPPALLFAAILVVFSQVVHQNFVNLDDDLYITQNAIVQKEITGEGIAWAFTTFHSFNWHPVTWISHMIDCQVYGLNPGMHKTTNVLFHFLNTILLFLIFQRMTHEKWKSFAVAALFALHPTHVESVAWVSERKDVLSTFFWLLTTFSYFRYLQHQTLKRYLPILFFFLMGLMAKPMLVTLPFTLLLLDFWPLGRFRFSKNMKTADHFASAKPLVTEKIPMILMAIASSIITFMAQHQGGAVQTTDILPMDARIGNALTAYGSYLAKLFFPYRLSVYYPYPDATPLWKTAGAAFILISISLIAVKKIRPNPYILTGWLWYLGTLIPVIGIIQVGSQAMADRYTYVPFIGLFIIICWLIPELVREWRYKKELLTGLTVSAMIILTVSSYIQAGYWKNSYTLFSHAIDVTKNNHFAHVNIASACQNDGDTEKALFHYREALSIDPDAWMAHSNLGQLLVRKGDMDLARIHLEKAVSLNPDDAKAHDNLGILFTRFNDWEKAYSHFQRALEIEPDNATINVNMGTFCQFRGMPDQAIRHFNHAITIDPYNAVAHYNLGIVFEEKGEREKAQFHYSHALKIDPGYGAAKERLDHLLK